MSTVSCICMCVHGTAVVYSYICNLQYSCIHTGDSAVRLYASDDLIIVHESCTCATLTLGLTQHFEDRALARGGLVVAGSSRSSADCSGLSRPRTRHTPRLSARSDTWSGRTYAPLAILVERVWGERHSSGAQLRRMRLRIHTRNAKAAK